MNVEIRAEDGYFSVYVDGRRTVERESFTIADRIAYCLTHPEAFPKSECRDVADVILEHEKSVHSNL